MAMKIFLNSPLNFLYFQVGNKKNCTFFQIKLAIVQAKIKVFFDCSEIKIS